MLVSAMRDSFLAECAMFNAGGIRYVALELLGGLACRVLNHLLRSRANKDYPEDQRFFTFSDFESEMPFNNELCVVRMPGRVCTVFAA